MEKRTDKRKAIIEAGIIEAERFIVKAKEAIKRLDSEINSDYTAWATKETGAVKRTALDVKRAMTDINQMTTY